MIKLKRAYDAPSDDDGLRILVERLWPRGLSKPEAEIGIWMKDVAPSTALRKWFGHDPRKWPEFERRYIAELKNNKEAVDQLIKTVKKAKTATFIYAARDQEHNGARALKSFLEHK